MTINKCPGIDMRFWTTKDIYDAPCPNCGAKVEFWKDDTWRRCPKCGHKAPNPKLNLGCAEWCKFAKDCPAVAAAPSEATSLKDALVAEMQTVFGSDHGRSDHAMEVLENAWEILSVEGGDPLVVTAAAILHDIGIAEAEAKHGSSAAEHQETEGPPIARRILAKLGVEAERIDHICRIVASHHSAKDIDTREFKIIWDADRLANAGGERSGKGSDEIAEFIEQMYRTETGKAVAKRRLLGEKETTDD